MVDFAFKKKAVNMQIPKDHMVEMTPEIHKMINQLVNIQSKCLLQASALASHRRAVDLLKEKSNFWREKNCQTEIIQNWTLIHYLIDSNPWQDQAGDEKGVNEKWKRRNRIERVVGWRFYELMISWIGTDFFQK